MPSDRRCNVSALICARNAAVVGTPILVVHDAQRFARVRLRWIVRKKLRPRGAYTQLVRKSSARHPEASTARSPSSLVLP